MRRYGPLLIVILAIAARLVPGPRTIDDAYITYRYARNLVSGEGFVYNPGEPVLGTTTPLYAMLMAGLGLVSGREGAPFPELALGVNALADGLTVFLLLAIGKKLQAPWAGLGAALVWAIAPFSVTFAIGGLETSLYVLLLVGIFYAQLAGHRIRVALLSALALLTRPDALILLGPLGVERMLSAWKRPDSRIQLKELVAFLGPTLTWVLFATIQFGTPISHSVTAKSMAYRLPPNAAFIRLLQHYATPFLDHLTFGTLWIGIGLILYPALYLIGARHGLRRQIQSWPFLAFPWLYFGTFALANPLIFRWYMTPPLPFYIFGILIGAELVTREVLEGIQRRRSSPIQGAESNPTIRFLRVIPPLVIILVPLGLSLRDWSLRPDHGLQRPAPGMAWYQLELYYRQAAEFLKPHLDSGTTLAASDVGVLGFYTPARILDTVGLNSPEALGYYPVNPSFYVINLATSPDLIADTRPDFVVLLEVYGREGVFKDPRFQSEYHLLKKITTDIYGSDGMMIFGLAPKHSRDGRPSEAISVLSVP